MQQRYNLQDNGYICEVIYVPEDTATPFIWLGQVAKGVTIEQVIQESGLYALYPDTKQLSVGIFAKPVSRDLPVKDGDRIEVYRPLRYAPMENRRRRTR